MMFVLLLLFLFSVFDSEHQKRLGAEVYLQPLVPFSNSENYAKKAEKIAQLRADEGAVYLNQFENIANFSAHYNTTGPEIWDQTQVKKRKTKNFKKKS
jgi:cysteine synthase A